VHLKTSFEHSGKEQQVKRKRVKVQQQQAQETTTTTTTERYLTADEIIEPAIKRLVVAAGLKIKDPRNRHISVASSSSPSSKSNSEEQIHRGNNYEAVKVIVARKSTTTAAPEARRQDVFTSNAPQIQDHSTAATMKPVVTRRVLRKKIRINKNNAISALPTTSTESSRYESTPQPQRSSTPELFQKVSNNEPTTAPPTRPNTTTVRTTQRTTLRTTSTTPYYESDDYYEPTRPIKNYGFDVFGRTEDEDEDEVLARAAQEYYQASELFGRKQRN